MGGDAALTDTHYVEVARGYEAAFFYESGAYQDWLLAQLLERLELVGGRSRDLRVVDLGGGTGNFTAALAAAAGLTRPVLCVDNSAPMLAVAAGRAGVTPREQDTAAFAASTDADATGYHRVLLKEIVHHVAADDVAPMYAGLARQLAPGGLCVTVTRPQEVDYPLWPAAREVWRAAQPPAERLAAQVADAGLQVEVHEAVYTARLPKERWFAMVRARFWSTFAAFDDAGLEQGVALLQAEHEGVDCVTFNDRLIIIVGRKPEDLSEQALAFARDGLLPRCRVLSPPEAEAAYAGLGADFRRYEAACGGTVAGELSRLDKHCAGGVGNWELPARTRLVPCTLETCRRTLPGSSSAEGYTLDGPRHCCTMPHKRRTAARLRSERFVRRRHVVRAASSRASLKAEKKSSEKQL